MIPPADSVWFEQGHKKDGHITRISAAFCSSNTPLLCCSWLWCALCNICMLLMRRGCRNPVQISLSQQIYTGYHYSMDTMPNNRKPFEESCDAGYILLVAYCSKSSVNHIWLGVVLLILLSGYFSLIVLCTLCRNIYISDSDLMLADIKYCMSLNGIRCKITFYEDIQTYCTAHLQIIQCSDKY